MARERVAAIIIKDKKILLVRDTQADFFSMPGGGIDAGEDHQTALRRELQEELCVDLVTANFYFSFDLINQTYLVPQVDHVYITSIESTPTPAAEVCELGWFTGEQIKTKAVKTPTAFYEKLLPKLIEDGLL